MALDESHRRELFDALDSALGPGPAATLMAHLPPVGWADVATKHDLHELERRLDLRFEAAAHRTDAAINRLAAELRAEMVAQTRALFLGVAAMTFTVAGLSFVAARAGG